MSAPLPEIREADAPPDVAAIYAEIRAASGLPLVNLIWRHLASLPGALPWAWRALRPLARRGLIAGAADRVCAGLPATPQARLQTAALAAVGVHETAPYGGLPTIRRLLDAYNRGNAFNLVAFTALLNALSRDGATAAPGDEDGAVAAGRAEPLPPLPRLAELEPRARESVEALAAAHAGYAQGAVPSLYLHLAHWPGFLDQARGVVEPLPRAQWRERACALAEAEAETLAAQMTPGEPPSGAREPVERALRTFAQGLIPEMLPVGLALRRALPV